MTARRVLVRDDRGVAALELGILVSVLLLIAFGALPLYALMRGYQKVSKASAGALRYATAVAPSGTHDADGTFTRRPSYDDIERLARDTAGTAALEVVVTVCHEDACTDITSGDPAAAEPIPARAGDTVRLTVRHTVDLSVLGRLANAVSRVSGNGVRFPENDMTVTATASAREE